MQLNNAINSSGTKIKVYRALSLGYAALLYVACSCVAYAGTPIAQVTSNPPLASPVVRDVSVMETDKAGYADKVYWPMMPGESLEQLANTLYPDSPILKERFIKKTLSFSRALGDDVQPNEVFTSSRLLIIPNEKAVKELTHRIRKSEEVQQEEEALRMSYRLKASPAVAAVLPPISTTTPASTSTAPAQAQLVVTSAAVATPSHDNTSLVTNSHVTNNAASANVATPTSVASAKRPTATSASQASSSAFWDKLTMPTMHMPEMQWPKLEWPAISLPELHMPAWRLPEVNVPNMEWPAIEIPSMQVPDVTLPNIAWQPYWQATTLQLSAWYQHSMIAIQGAARVTQQRTSSLLDDYQGKNATQVLHDYRLRNIALVSVLVMVFLVLWGLHIQRKRQQKKMLSMIENTIAHRDAEFEIVIPAAASLEASSSDVESAALQEALVEPTHHTLVTDAPALTQVYEQKNYH